MSYARKAMRGVGIIFFMNALAYMVAYVTRLVLARKLGPADYGLFYSVFVFVLFFLFFRDLGLTSALTKYITEFNVHGKLNEIKTAILVVLGSQLAGSIIFSSVFFLSAGFLAKYYFKSPAAEWILKFMVIYTIGSVVFTFTKGFFSGFQKFRIYGYIDLVKNSLVLVMITIFFYLNMDILSPVLAYVLAGPLLALIFLPIMFKTYNPLKYDVVEVRPVTKSLYLFGLPVIMTDVGDKVISYIDTIILTYFRPLAEIGVYNVVLPSAMTLLFPGMAVASVVFPIFAELWAKKDIKRLNEGVKLINKYTFIIVGPLVMTIGVFADIFLRIFFGKEYVAGALALQILLVGVLLFVVAGINHNIISAIGYPKTVTKIILAAAATNAIINIILIPKYGIEGAALATTLSYALALVLSTYKVSQYIKTPMPIKIWIKTAVASFIFVGTTYSIKNILPPMNPYAEIAIAAAGALSVYIISIFALKLININEIKTYASKTFQKAQTF